MKTQIRASLKLIAIVVFSSFLFTQAKAQCVANWGSTISMCTVTLTNTSTGTNNNTYYYWSYGNGQTSNLQSPPSHTYVVSGTYQVCLTLNSNDSTCYSTLCKYVTIQCPTTGIASSSQIDLSLSVNNPVFSSADINYSIPSGGSVKLSLFDIVGNKISVLENGNKNAGAHSYLFSTGDF